MELIPVKELTLIKAAKKDKLPEGGVWRTIKGHKVYIKDGEILAGHVPGVTDKPDFKKLASKHGKTAASEAPKTTTKPKKPAAKKAEPKKPAKQTKAEAEAVKARKAIDEIANIKPKEPKKKTVEQAMKESKKATDEALKKPNPKAPKKTVEQAMKESKKATDEALKKPNDKAKPGKGATKADLDKVVEENAKNKKPAPKAPTKEDLDEMFGTGKKPAASEGKKSKGKKDEVAVIRSEKQTNNEVAYDVGKKIGGARKDIAAQQKAIEELMGRKSGQSLQELEKISPELAQKNCVKKNILPPIDFEAEFKAGTDINVAMTKQLIYDRILPKPKGDTPEERAYYLSAIQNLQRALEPIKKWDELKLACRNLGDRMKSELPKTIDDNTRYLDYAKKQLTAPITEYDRRRFSSRTQEWETVTDKQVMDERAKRVAEMEARMKLSAESLKNPYSVLGEKLMNFFTDYESRNRTFDTVAKKKLDWNNYFKQSASEAPKEKKGESNRRKWEREMPAKIQRSGGRTSKVEKPEDMIKAFNFRGVEFGNWVDDTSGNFHMKKCAEAFMDLADIIGISDKDVSLNGRLAMAFGARGQGWALAHYEPVNKAINITKEGGAGTLAHEWGHAMDNILYQESAGRSSTNYGSDGLEDQGSPEVKAAYKELMKEILFGTGMGQDTVPNKHNTYYSYHPAFKQAVQELGLGGAIKKASDMLREKHTKSIEYYNTDVRNRYGDATADKYIAKLERQHKTALNDMVQEMAYHHEKLTGEVLEEIPAYTGHSQYYVDSSKQAKSSDYWTSPRELFARAFENYIEGKMKSGKVKNDYLVHGTYFSMPGVALPYPQGEERDRIHKGFDKLMEAVRKTKAIQKALTIMDMEKSFREDYGTPRGYKEKLVAMEERKDPYRLAKEGKESFTEVFYMELKRELNQRDRNAYNVADTSEVFFIPINRLKTEYQTELALDFNKIRSNVERMKNGENLEPVVIGYDYDVHDGHHRIEASKIMKYTHVPCVVGGSNEIDVQRAKEAYSEVWKALILEALDPEAFPYEATGLMFRGIGQKEFDFIQKEGYIQSKGKGNDEDQGVAVTCFTNLFTQAEGYARSQYDLYHEKHAYVLAVERPIASEENELGEIEVAGKIPVNMIRGILPVQQE